MSNAASLLKENFNYQLGISTGSSKSITHNAFIMFSDIDSEKTLVLKLYDEEEGNLLHTLTETFYFDEYED